MPWRVPPGHSRNQNRTEGGVAARAIKTGRLASRADLHRPLACAREPQAEPNGPSARLVLVHARASACQGGVHAKKTAHSRTRALAHRALAHLKIQTTTHPESPPRRAARAVVPVVWVSCAVHEPTQRGEEHRTNGGVAVWAVQTGSSQCELTQWPLAEARKAKEKPAGVSSNPACALRAHARLMARVVAFVHQKAPSRKAVLIGRLWSCEPTRRPLH